MAYTALTDTTSAPVGADTWIYDGTTVTPTITMGGLIDTTPARVCQLETKVAELEGHIEQLLTLVERIADGR